MANFLCWNFGGRKKFFAASSVKKMSRFEEVSPEKIKRIAWKFTKTVILLGLAGYELIITNSAYGLVGYIYQLISGASSKNNPASVACAYSCLHCKWKVSLNDKMVHASTTTELLVGSSMTNLQNNYISCFSVIYALVKGIWPFPCTFHQQYVYFYSIRDSWEASNQIIASFFNTVMHKFFYHRKVLRIDIHFFSTQVYHILLQIVLSYSWLQEKCKTEVLYCGSNWNLEHNEKVVFLFNEMALKKFLSNVWVINNLLLCCMNFRDVKWNSLCDL